jgi:hypothetical protein
MKKIIGWTFAIVLIVGVIVIFDLWRADNMSGSQMQPQAAAPIEATKPKTPAVEEPAHYPLPQPADTTAEKAPLPSLQDSDPSINKSLSDLLGRKEVAAFFYPEKFIRRIVATVDNLPRHTLSIHLVPVKPVAGKFLTTGDSQTLSIAPENAARYQPYVHLLQKADTRKLVSFYVHFYPLFQKAYQDLGYPDGFFNDRLIAVIDHLLATQEMHEPIRVVQPKVFYQFADQDFENASSGRKILMRMGPGNAAKVKQKLREIRKALTAADLK